MFCYRTFLLESVSSRGVVLDVFVDMMNNLARLAASAGQRTAFDFQGDLSVV